MTRLSDSLRGLADRAPIDHANVSVAGAARRIQRGRRLRAAANATAGVGVAVVVALAAIHPGASGGLGGDDAHSSANDSAAGFAEGDAPSAMEDSSGSGAGVAWNACGARPFESGVVGEGEQAQAVAIELLDFAQVWQPGDVATTELTVTRAVGGPSEAVSAPTALVVWDGYVVGVAPAGDDATVGVPVDDGVARSQVDVPLVNCWDGADLPPGTYQVVVVQDFRVEHSGAGDGAPATEPSPAPSASAAPSTIAEDDVRADYEQQRAVTVTAWTAVSPPVEVVVAGDPAESDPFARYISGDQVAAPSYPADYLHPDRARAEYAARVTLEPWNFAPGSQRVVLAQDVEGDGEGQSVASRYFGCPWDATPATAFPAESAQWDLLDVTATLPSRVDLSYGWVVDNNPRVDLTVENVSDYAVPGFWGEPNAGLMLVKDGRVVGEAYLTPLERQGMATAYAANGILSAGQVLGAQYLWRDLSGCWVGDRQTTVEPGTYTVVNVQSLYLDNGGEGPVALPEPGFVNTPEADDVETRPGAEPAYRASPGTIDYVELQVWTSLGTISVN